MSFDVIGARNAGYTDSEIAQYLAGENGFDYFGAVKSGYSDQEVLSHLLSKSDVGIPEDSRSAFEKTVEFARDAILPVPANAYAQVKGGVGGLLRQAGELTGMDSLAETGKEWSDDAKVVEQQILAEHGTDPNDWTTATRGALTSTYQQLPAMAAGGILAGAVRGMAGMRAGLAAGTITAEEAAKQAAIYATKAKVVSLAPMGGMEAGNAYNELRDKGNSPVASAVGGHLSGAVEVGTEWLPTGQLFEMLTPTAKWSIKAATKELGKYYGEEMVGESLSTFLQDSIQKAMQKPNMTTGEMAGAISQYVESGEALQNFLNTLKSTAVQSTVMGGGAGVARYGMSPSDEYVRQQQPDAGTIPPAVQQPGELVKPANEIIQPSGPLSRAVSTVPVVSEVTPEAMAVPEQITEVVPPQPAATPNELLLDEARAWAADKPGMSRVVGEGQSAYLERLMNTYLKQSEPNPVSVGSVEGGDVPLNKGGYAIPAAPVINDTPMDPAQIQTVQQDDAALDLITDEEKQMLSVERDMASAWEKGSWQNGKSNKAQIFPWLASWGKTTPAEVSTAIDNFLSGKRLGDVQKQLVVEALKGGHARNKSMSKLKEVPFEFTSPGRSAAKPVSIKDQIDQRRGMSVSQVDELTRQYGAETGIDTSKFPLADRIAFVNQYKTWKGAHDVSLNNPSLNEKFPDRGGADTNLSGDTTQGVTGVEQRDSQINIPTTSSVSTVGSADSSTLENGSDGTASDTQNTSDLLKTQSVVSEGNGISKGPIGTNHQVQSLVLPLSHDEKVVNGVVETVPVDVVDNLDSGKISTEKTLHDNTMLEPLSSDSVNLNTDKPVTGVVTREKPDMTSTAGASHISTSDEMKPIIINDSSNVKSETKPEAKNKVEDAGEELKANKRNKVSGLKFEDIKDENDAFKVNMVKKDKVYPKPDYQALVDGGMQPLIAHVVKQTYDSLAVAPVVKGTPTNEDFQQYIAAVNRVMAGTLKWANDREAILNFANRNTKTAGAMLGHQTNISSLLDKPGTTLLDFIYPDGWRNSRPEVQILGGNRALHGMQPGYDEISRAMKDIDKGWPGKIESWQKQGWKIVDKAGFAIDEVQQPGDRGSIFFVRKKVSSFKRLDAAYFKDRGEAQAFLDGLKDHLLFNKRDRLDGHYDSMEEAKEAARFKTKKDSKSAIEERGMNVADAERVGPAYREEGENVTSEKLVDVFGFRGVNFGNWVPQDERQLHLNHAYDSFYDLATILNVPPKALSLNGMLGLAIGAQGSGSALAHFVPGYNEINITRTNGAGSVAHEFAHALDHYFANQAGFGASQSPWLTVHKRQGTKGEARPEIITAFADIVRTMEKRLETPEELAKREEMLLASETARLDRWLKYFTKKFAAIPEVASQFEVLSDRMKSGDYGSGEEAYVSISKGSGRNIGTAVLSIVADVRNLAKSLPDKPGIEDYKALHGALSFMKYLETKQEGGHAPQNVNTRYLSNAKSLDKDKKKEYWSTPLEMFARAFDAYVSDKLAEESHKNDYLSHTGRESETVPTGDERTTINKAFDVLVGELKTRETDNGIALFAKQDREETGSSLSEVEFDAVFDRITAKFDSADTRRLFEVVDTFEQLPAAIRNETKKQGERPENVSGVFHRNKVYLVRENIASEAWLEEVMFHEWHGHYGLNLLFGGEVQDGMLDLYNKIGAGKLFAIGKKYGVNLMKYGKGLATAGYDVDTRRAIMTEEMLAFLTKEYSQPGSIRTSVRTVIGQVRAWLREKGFVKLAEYGETDIAWLLKRARMYAEAGVGDQNKTETVVFSYDDLVQRLEGMGLSEEQLQEVLEYQPKYMTAWHGSPHSFDSFSTESIGTGEGNQAYGYGLYFAGAKEVAEYYRETLATGPSPVLLNGKPYKGINQVENTALAEFAIYGDSLTAMEELHSRKDWPGMEDPEFLEEAIDWLRENQNELSIDAPGGLYQVELAPQEDEYLLWDKPLSEQSETVKTALLTAINDKMFDAGQRNRINESPDKASGAFIYKNLTIDMVGPDIVSAYLHALGIRGIKYLDGTSRAANIIQTPARKTMFGPVAQKKNYNYVIFNDADVAITARFALKSALENVQDIPWNKVAEDARSNWKAILNPFDWSRTAHWFDDWTPTAIKSGLGYVFANPHFEAERDAAKKSFVDEGAQREIDRMNLMLNFFGYTPGQGDPRTKTEQFKDFFTKWHSGQESTAWEALNQRYAKLDKEQNTAINVLAVQGDVNNTYYGSYRTAMLNKKNSDAKLTQETFDLYNDVYRHMEKVAELRAMFTEQMMLEAGIAKAVVDKHIADYRNEVRSVQGWLSRNHGSGEYATNVHHVVTSLPFTRKKVLEDNAEQAFLKFYPGVVAMGKIEKLAKAEEAQLTLNGKGSVIVTSKKGKNLDEFMAGVAEIMPEIGPQRVKVYARYQTNKGFAEMHANKVRRDLKAAIPENFLEGETYQVNTQQVDVLSEDIYQNMKSDMAMEAGLQKALDKAFKSGEMDKVELETLQDNLIHDTAEILLGRAAGKYQIRRAPYLIEGYETDNLMSNYQDYMTSVAGLLSKADYARKQFAHLKKAGVGVKQWAYRYVFDSLRNMGWGDRLSGNVRAFVALWYMGLKPATVLINATQIYTIGVAEIGRVMKKGQSATMIIGKAQKDVLANNLTEAERKIFDSAVIRQQEAASAMSQITGHNEGGTGKASKLLQNVTGKAMALFQNIEIMNRKTMILAAYRTLRDQSMPDVKIDEEALQKALEINNNTNFDQGRHNLPGWARNPVGHTLYALQSFTWNNFNWLYNRATSGEKRDTIALMRYTGMLLVIGGASALAGGDELDRLYRKLKGKSLRLEAKEWTRRNAKKYGTLAEMAEAFAWNGLPSVAGVNISNSMRLQMPVVSQMIGDATMPEAFAGVYAGLFKKAWLTTQALAYGNFYRAAESASPEFIAGAMRAYRQYDKGATTLRGKPIFDEHGKQLKYSGTDAALRVAGFQPAEQSRRMEVSMVGKEIQLFWKDKRSDLLSQLRNASPEERRKVRIEIMQFNRDLRKSQASGLVGIIKAETMANALKAKPNKQQMKWSQNALGD